MNGAVRSGTNGSRSGVSADTARGAEKGTAEEKKKTEAETEAGTVMIERQPA